MERYFKKNVIFSMMAVFLMVAVLTTSCGTSIKEESDQPEASQESEQSEASQEGEQSEASQESEQSEASQEVDQSAFPLEANEYLILTIGESNYAWLGGDMVLVLDSAGEEIIKWSNYGMIGNSDSMSKGIILKETTPLQIFTDYEDGTRQYSDAVSAEEGLYSLKDLKWIVEPSKKFLKLLSDNLYMDEDMVGGVYKTDGTCIKELSDGMTRQGNYVIDSQNVYNLDGQELMTLDGMKFRAVIDEDILLIGYHDDGSHWTQLVKTDGTVLWTEDSGLIWNQSIGEYSSWTDGEGKGQILAAGDVLEVVLTEEEFLTKNSDVQGSGMCLAAVKESSQNEKQFFIRMTDDETGNSRFYLCDEEFHVVTAYPENQVYWNETDGQLWHWNFSEEGGRLENLLTGEVLNWEQDGFSSDVTTDVMQVEVLQTGNTLGMIYQNPSGVGETFVCGIGEEAFVYTDNNEITARMTTLNDGTVEVYILSGAYTENEKYQIIYYTPEGKQMERLDSVLFCNQSMRCIQMEEKIEIQDLEGNVLKTIQISN